MTSGKQSKAQRRVDSQRRAAEKRAAELHKKRVKMATRGGGILAVVVVIVLIVVIATSGSNSTNPKTKNPNVPTVAIPASLHTIPPPKTTTPGPETIPLATGPRLATLVNAATGQTVDGIQCQTNEQTVTHVHTHLTVFVNGQSRVIPYGIGIPGAEAQAAQGGAFVSTGSCFYWLHAHANDGIIHVESPSTSDSFTLGEFFDIWGQPLSTTQVGPAKGTVTAFFNGKLYKGNPRNLPLGNHYQIQLDVGTPIVAPVNITNWGGL
jgi:hypothetical protein